MGSIRRMLGQSSRRPTTKRSKSRSSQRSSRSHRSSRRRKTPSSNTLAVTTQPHLQCLSSLPSINTPDNYTTTGNNNNDDDNRLRYTFCN
ncbi:hypothetical protein Pmani_027514 [Petrolisthes manimaculis]|uniref:Uncharacterized protein n=1 Tax=Petrolisthes manimaculis TaxID=1843537 RepID=A0AAE1P196_9EUCA|nr:hypothetical protein Pmani_027514 [Petrolisthes manimaculis]